MASTYRTKYGIDFPPEFSDIFIEMTLAKKWKLYRDRGFDISGFDPGECLERAIRALWPDSIKMSPWAKTMIHDFAREDKYAMIGCGSCGKSFTLSACMCLFWTCDPLNTAVVIGSATLKDLAGRAWSPTVSLFSELKNNKKGIPIPGKLLSNMYSIVNERDENLPETMTAKAAIQGRALDEGRLQGLHTEWLAVFVDELALVRDIESLKTHLTNMRIGTLGFKFVSAANPEPWEHSNSCFYIPPKDVKVDVDTGSWRSQMGYFVRHFDGLKSPVVLDPTLKSEYPFLMSQEDVQAALDLCGGDPDHPRMWKMCRGFPLASGLGEQTILDPLVAAQSRCTAALDAPIYGGRRRIGLCAGADPAWSEGGDDAILAGCEVLEQDGRVILDFSGRISKLPITIKSTEPVTKQLRDGVIRRMTADGGPDLKCLYVDASGNQGLADDLDIYVGPGCGHINSSKRASEFPLRALDSRPAKEHIYDRGTEAAMVLAEFIKAGQVRGLPQRAVDALVQRRFMTRPKSNDPIQPLRLEGKEGFISRFKGSPNDGDACALAALAAKERLGVMPFGGVPPPQPGGVVPNAAPQNYAPEPELPDTDYTADY